MQTLLELGEEMAVRRRARGLKQGRVAMHAGITQETLPRFEHGKAAEFGARKLLAVLAVLGLEPRVVEREVSDSLNKLRRECGGA